ncbi:MAG: ATP-dependent RNA helicase HrpA [Halochromatium sp.]|nr:ATP-dependent RNA helicase HrpA [Halochromatium sp.]
MSTRRQDTLAAIAHCLLKDRRRLKRTLKRLSVSVTGGQPGSASTEDHDHWRDLARAIDQSRAIVDARRAAIPSLIPFPPELPVSERRDEIAKLIEQHQVIVLCGETGSGKSTQLPKICLELGRGLFGRIGHTQPRRIAARSLASRVAAELGTELGSTVGYKVRFHDRVRPETSVKLMTDGILLAEIQRDRYLNEYDTLIIDEAHERSLNIDFLLGYLKQLLPKRPDLKLIITSATIDPQRFAKHFGAAAGAASNVAADASAAAVGETAADAPTAGAAITNASSSGGAADASAAGDVDAFGSGGSTAALTSAGASNDSATENAAANANAVGQGQGANPGKGSAAPIIEISGRTYPVEVRYRPPEEEHAGERDDAMQQAISDAVAELAREGPGDVLVFLSGEREIRETAETLRKHHPPSTEVLPLYARQGPAEQARVFQPHGTRRVVLATNVAETSLTVPGIHYVIDPGFARISRYSHRSKVQRLPVERISQASADQRKGRCGRIASGVCIRLYDEDNFTVRAEHTEPEIRRSNLAAVILQMKQLGFGEIERFPFVDPPDSRLISDGYRALEELAAIDAKGDLTPIGKQLARLPVDPRIGRMLLAGAEHHCLRELSIIAAALAVQDPRERPIDQQQAADEIHATFRHPDSDFLGFLNLWEFLEKERRHLTRRKFQRLCKQHFLSWNRVQEWRDTQIQLHELMAEMGYRENREQGLGKQAGKHAQVAGKHADNPPSHHTINHQAEGTYEEVHRALLTGLLSNIGRKDEQREYQGARGGRFYIHPGSTLFAATPKWIICAERVETARQYGRTCARVQPAWIEAAGQHLVKRSWSEPHWQSRSGQVAAFETVTLYGITLFSRRRVNYGPINPTEAREVFLRSALVEGDFETRAPFWRHNQELIEFVHQLEAKSRRRDILVDEEGLYAFYQQRLPSGIYSKPQFERWLRKATQKQPKLLHMDLEQVMQQDARAITGEQFPDRLQIGATELPLEYRFEPGHEADGVTLVLPAMLINQVSPERLQWLVPGLLEERITAMLRGLPKTLRRSFVPMPDTAAQVAARLMPSDRPLVRALGEELKALTGVQVPEDAWDEAALPPYLRMKLRLVDLDGRTLAFDDDLLRLKRRLAEGVVGDDQRAPAGQFVAVPGSHPSGNDAPGSHVTRAGASGSDLSRRHARGSTTAGGHQAAVAASVTAALGSANPAAAWGHAIERDGITRWDFGALPESVDLDRAGIKLRGWPALVDQGDAVAIRVLDAQHSAVEAMRGGLRRLFMLALGADLRTLRRGLCDTAGGLSRLRLQYAKAPQTGPTAAGPDLADELLALILDLTFTEGQPPIRDQASFEQRLKTNKPRLFPVAQEVCSLAASILGTYQAVRKRLDGITQVQWMSSVLDMRAHLDSLVYRGFLVQIPFAHLQDYPRYLRALEQRAEKLPQAATRDRERMQELAPLLERWRERVAAAADAERQDERLDEIHWMLEELRVSLFAQQLGTAYPVSVKRLERRWRELGL